MYFEIKRALKNERKKNSKKNSGSSSQFVVWIGLKIFCGFLYRQSDFGFFFLDRQSAQYIFFCCFCLDLFQNFFYLSGSAQILILFVWIGSQSPSGSFIQTPVNQFAPAANSNNNCKLLLLLLFLRFIRFIFMLQVKIC